MLFSKFAQYLQQLESISSRLEMTSKLAELFKELEIEEVTEACYLLQGQLLPAYEALEFQIAVKTVIKALARLLPSENVDQDSLFGDSDFSKQEEQIEKKYRQVGDLGLVATEVSQAVGISANHSKLHITEVYGQLCELAKDSGAQSQQRKLATLVELLKKLEPISAKFVIRIILGRLRLGFSDMTMIDGLSWAMTGGKSEHDALEQAYQKKTDIGKLAHAYLQQTDPDQRHKMLEKYTVEVGVPVMPALCQRLNSAGEIIEKMHEVIAEPKYDGLRVQIHYRKGVGTNGHKHFIRTFTRNLEETSHMFPELETAVEELNCESCILDAEAITYDVNSGELLPFQQTIQRKRKHGVEEKAEELPIRFYVFDILSLNDQDLLQKPLRERKNLLHQLFNDDQTFYHSPELHTKDPEKLHHYHEENLANGLEGVVVKQIDSVYQSGRKGWSWVKIKESEGKTGKLADTLDLLVMGYYFGRGKRAEFGLGAVLVGVFDEKQDKVLTVAKVGTGLTDQVLQDTKKRCDALKIATQPPEYQVNKMLLPDVWCLPGFVIEVAADELTTSPIHTAGLALRFPRLVQFRDDKDWQQATSFEEVHQLAQQALR
jgi:DNA ligase-1